MLIESGGKKRPAVHANGRLEVAHMLRNIDNTILQLAKSFETFAVEIDGAGWDKPEECRQLLQCRISMFGKARKVHHGLEKQGLYQADMTHLHF